MVKPTQSAAGGSTGSVVRRLPVSTAPRGAADQAVFSADANARAAAIGAAPPFAGWPRAALLGLAQAARAVPYAPGELLYRHGEQTGRVAVVAAGHVESSVMAPDGRRVVFALDAPGRAYGLIPLIDGLPMTNDMIFTEPGLAIEIPFEAVHGALSADPSLWASVARESNARGRRFTEQLKSFLFDALRYRAASLLLGLLAPQGQAGKDAAPIEWRISQERFAEMLGVSRQTATTLVRAFVRQGLVQWRYGRVTVLDRPGLQALADAGIDRLAQRHAARAPRRSAVAANG
jgi:CRP/FNR family cyclic AMP-dependent transcriptional regulator